MSWHVFDFTLLRFFVLVVPLETAFELLFQIVKLKTAREKFIQRNSFGIGGTYLLFLKKTVSSFNDFINFSL